MLCDECGEKEAKCHWQLINEPEKHYCLDCYKKASSEYTKRGRNKNE